MRVSVIQMSSGAEVAKNIEQARGLIDPAITARVRRDMPILEHRRLA
jgi:predicted amidohydrolase